MDILFRDESREICSRPRVWFGLKRKQVFQLNKERCPGTKRNRRLCLLRHIRWPCSGYCRSINLHHRAQVKGASWRLLRRMFGAQNLDDSQAGSRTVTAAMKTGSGHFLCANDDHTTATLMRRKTFREWKLCSLNFGSAEYHTLKMEISIFFRSVD